MIDKNKPKNRIEFIEMIHGMLKRKFENMNINVRYNGLEVEYDSELNGKHQLASSHIQNIRSSFSLANQTVRVE